VFRGINAVNIDSKGRMAMPTRYRERLQLDAKGVVVITIDTEENCLLLYPLPAWEVIELKLTKLPSFNSAARRIQRLLIGHATEVELDSQGRVLVPSLLRDYAKLEKKSILLGQGTKFELWSERAWGQRRRDWLDEEHLLKDLPGELEEIAL